MRRILNVAILASLLWSLGITCTTAQTFPSSRVTLVVPFVPGGPGDILARGLAAELGNLWNVPVIVENIAGGNSLTGMTRVANATPDGYTLLVVVDTSILHNRFLYKKMPFDIDKSFIPITMIARSAQFVLANTSFPANNLNELVDVARRTPTGLNYGSAGVGSQPQLLFETIGKRYNVKFVQVPYKGMAPVITALLTGEIQLTTGGPAVAGALLADGTIKALAIGGTKRSEKYPDVPTITESGFAGINALTWWGLFSPAGMDATLVEQINHDVISVAKKPEFVAKYFTSLGIEPVLNSPSEFTEAIRIDVALTAEMVKAAGVKPLD